MVHDAAGAAPPTTWASCGSRWRRRRSPRCCWSACTGRRRASRRLEVLHPVRRRHRAGAVRHDPALFRRREGARRRRRSALLWTHLNAVKGAARARRSWRLAFVFLLVGYGTKVGLAPLHNWLPDAHAEGPTPISAVLSGLLLNVALYAVVRCKVLVDGALQHRASPAQPAHGLRPALGRARRVLPVAPARRQAPVRLLLDRAHGDHHVRLRHGRPGRELRRRSCT